MLFSKIATLSKARILNIYNSFTINILITNKPTVETSHPCTLAMYIS